MQSLRVVAALAVCFFLCAPTSARASGSDNQYCTEWKLGQPSPSADGGTYSTDCTCNSWSGYGGRYDCELCEGTETYTTCAKYGAYHEPAGSCSVSGGGVGLGLAAAVLGAVGLRRRIRR